MISSKGGGIPKNGRDSINIRQNYDGRLVFKSSRLYF